MPLTEILDTRIVVVGTAGSGKTYAAKGLVEQLLRGPSPRVCVVDPLGVWWGLRSNAAGNGSGFKIAVLGGDHADLPLNEFAGAVIAEAVASADMSCIVDLSGLNSQSARRRFMVAFAEGLYERNRAPLHLVLDEADLWAPQRPLPEALALLSRIDEIVRRGRVRGFIPWLITQRPAVLHKDVLSQADTLIAMKLTSSQDRDALKAWIEGQADRAKEREIVAALPGLHVGEGFVWAPALRVLEKQTFPKITTFDSSRTPKRGERIAEPQARAPLDLDALRAKLATVEAEVKAKDPALLKKRIAELEREIASLRQRGADPTIVDAAHRRGRGEGYDAAMREARRIVDALAREIAQAGVALAKAATAVEAPPPATPGMTAKYLARADEAAQRPPAEGITRPQQRILNALAWLAAVGMDRVDRTRLAFLADASPRSSAFANNLGALRSNGFIVYPGGDQVALTDAGRSIANTADAPRTDAELHAMIQAKVSVPQWRILRELIERRHETVERVALATAAGASPTSSAFANNLGFLRSLGLIDYPDRNRVAAADALFIEGA